MSDVLISIIVPVYKVEEVLLRNSLESACAQTYQKIEIIVIDDGSPDNCGLICDEFAKRDIRVKVFHTNNRGVSAARNKGMEESRGKYIFFLDSDDSIYPDTIKILFQVANYGKYDCVMCSTEQVRYHDNNKIENNSTPLKIREMDTIETIEGICYMRRPFRGFEMGAIWGCLFTRAIIGNNRFKEDIYIGEDFEFKYQCLRNSKKNACINKRLYKYLIRNDSAMRKAFDEKKAKSVLKLYPLIKNETNPILYMAVQSRVTNIALVILRGLSKEIIGTELEKDIKNIVIKNRWRVIFNMKSRSRVRIGLIVSLLRFCTK